MYHTSHFRLLLLLCTLGVFISSAADERMRLAIPRVTDPPPQIDGEGLRFATLPGQLALDTQDKVAYTAQSFKWDGADDSSGKVTFGWDSKCFYFFAVVKDDKHTQLYENDRLFNGDHVMLVFDMIPGGGTKTDLWKIGFTPGDFDKVKPAMHVWTPLGVTTEGIKFSTKKREDGYQLEASIPWSFFDLNDNLTVGHSFGFDCIIGDSDTGLTQKSMLSLNGKLGQHKPGLLPIAILGTPDGTVPPPPAAQIAITETPRKLKPNESFEVVLPADKLKDYPTLAVNAIIDHEKYSGGTYTLVLELNGFPLGLEQSVNRDETLTFGKYTLPSIGSQNTWFCFYNNAFDAKDYPDVFSAGDKIVPPQFLFDISSHLKPGQDNVLKVIYRKRHNVENGITVAVALTSEKKKALMSYAMGELQEYVPHALANPPVYSWDTSQDGALEVAVGGRTFTIVSSYSTRTPGWAILGKGGEAWQKLTIKEKGLVEAAAKEFAITRRIKQENFRLVVTDSVTNLLDEPLPLMYSHTAATDGLKYARICGTKISVRGSGRGPIYRENEGQCPTTMLVFDEASIGFVAEDDCMSTQGFNMVKDTIGGIENELFVLPPRKTMEVEFSVYPLENDDEFIFINRIRNDRDVNFTIPTGGMLAGFKHNLQNSDATVIRNISSKVNPETDIMIMGGRYHGNNLLEIDTTEMSQSIARIRRLFPNLTQLCYFHCFISQSEYDKSELLDEALLDAQGNQVYYGNKDKLYPLFEAVDGNRFTERMVQSIEKRFELGFDGIFWDELDRSCAKFDYNPRYWDGVTAEIDKKTHQITRRISTVCLLSQPWRIKMIERIMSRIKKPNALIGNGAPLTRTIRKYHFPRFIETGSVSNLRRGQLFTPLALGDHLTEQTELDAYRHAVRCLDYGCVYYWYHYRVMATHPMLSQAMFPITPIELGKGYIIAQERIVANKSGYYGWNDTSDFTTRVFDAGGREVPDFKVPRVIRNGKAFAELRLPLGYSAAIVKK
ncbi:MAG: hypothetical protein IKP00_11185 [Victivallales bacterium]|nr:hypothetical protein [Victivallales bacterium]